MAPSKMFALLAILALSWSAATANVIPQVIPPMMALATISHPCMQYCMLQQPFAKAGSPFASMIMQQPWASLFLQRQAFPIVGSSLALQQQCNCAAMSQMIQQQQIAIQMPYIFNSMAAATPLMYMTNPMAAAFQLPYLANPMAAAFQLPYMTNPMFASMQLPYPYNPLFSSIFNPVLSMFNPFAMASPVAFFQPFTAGSYF